MNKPQEKHYPDIDANPNFAQLEEEVLAFWQKTAAFKASVDHRPAKKDGKNNEFIFYDGPPFANGLPHYGHLLTGFVKDLVARYQTMQGKRVERRFGWDCHGLPAEMGAEKELGISGRAAITEYGIGKFNAHCESSVMKYAHEWEHYVTRQARWVDFKNDYKTMNRDYMESVLWAFKQLYDKGLIYESYRVMPYSWAAETPLSNFETKLDNSYRQRVDKAITVKFKLKEKPKGAPEAKNYYLLAWTTTPWTLPSNLALAVSKNLTYAFGMKDGDCYLLAHAAFSKYEKELSAAENDHSIAGEELLGISYEPLFPYFKDQPKAFRVIDGSDFITEGDGTGVVHIAPGFGEDDQRVATKNGIELVVPVDDSGRFTDELFDIPGLSLKGKHVIWDEPSNHKETGNEYVIRYLKEQGKIVGNIESYPHNYPHCWRTDTPLIYRALPSWYVAVTKFRDRAVELNKQINWIPEYIRDGQMEHMLATAPDWSISRNRFWGTPIPIWKSDKPDSEKLYVFGSIAELETFFDTKVDNLHRPYIDELTLPDPEDPKYTLRRVTDVFDCWFESGSMPFAQVHYPFENKEWFEHHFPADFITEYVGQTRGWFNTLIILATALFDKPPFKNCICHGVVLDAETGLKYSKRLKNYKDPLDVINQFGADALRWLMVSSPVMRGADLSVDPDGKFIRDVLRLAIKPIWNAYNFFCLYANADGVKAEFSTASSDIMDRYILAKCKTAIEQIEAALDGYDTPGATSAVTEFFEVLNNWYIRRSKDRFWKTEKDQDKQSAYNTLYTVLHIMCRAAAPLLPLTLETIYLGLGNKESVHLGDFPNVNSLPEDAELISQIDFARDVCNAALAIRNKLNIRVRQPLKEITIVASSDRVSSTINGKNWGTLWMIIRDEVNIKKLVSNLNFSIADYASFKLSINFPVLGKRLPDKIKQIIPASKKGDWKKLANGTLEVAGAILEPAEFTLQLEPKPEYKDRAQPLSTNDALVILDVTITPELEAEGIARDMVRMIQQARKDAGLNVSDRIHLTIEGSPAVDKAIETHKDYIAEQTLAMSIEKKSADAPKYRVENDLDGQKVVIALSVAV